MAQTDPEQAPEKPAQKEPFLLLEQTARSSAMNEGATPVRSPFPADVPAPTVAGTEKPGRPNPE